MANMSNVPLLKRVVGLTLYAAGGLLVKFKHCLSFQIALFIICFLLNIFYRIFVMFNFSGPFHWADHVKLFFLQLKIIFSSFEIIIILIELQILFENFSSICFSTSSDDTNSELLWSKMFWNCLAYESSSIS